MMDDNDITELAKGMVPFVRECMIEAFILPAELSERFAKAERYLHELPPIETTQRHELPPSRAQRLIRIERDDEGNFIPIYDEPQL